MKTLESNTKNKSAASVISVVFVLVIVAFFAAIFLMKKDVAPPPLTPGPEDISPQLPVPEPKLANELPVGTFSLSGDHDPIEVSVAGVEGKDTILLSWDDSQINMFYILLFDAELFHARSKNMLVWAISSLREGSLPESGIVKREDTEGLIPSGYTIGETILGLQTSPIAPEGVQLTVGREYVLQVNGFTENDEHININKEFIFTDSCLSPDCQ